MEALMAAKGKRFKIRDFCEGDEKPIALLFNEYMAGFVGPAPVTPQSWRRQYGARSWCGPSLADDPACARIAERNGKLIGYAVTNHDPYEMENTAAVQELCVTKCEDADEVVRELLADAERIAVKRGKQILALHLSTQDDLVNRAAACAGFAIAEDDPGTFMAVITDLRRFLLEIEAELSRRLGESRLKSWQGLMLVRSGEQQARLTVSGGRVKVAASGAPRVTVEVDPEALPTLLLGQRSVRDVFLQDLLSVQASDRMEALHLVDVLFPRLPLYLPRTQWW